MLIGVGINYFIPQRAFTYVTSIATVCGLAVWGMIVFAHVGYRRAVKEGRLRPSGYQLPGAPLTNWFVLGFLLLVLVLLAFSKDTVIALYVAPVWVAVMLVAYFASRSRHRPATAHLAAAGTYPPSSAGQRRADPST